MSEKNQPEAQNPGQEDIEEKIRRMLDPSVPDEPTPEPAPSPAEPEVSSDSTTIPVTAPELPSENKESKITSKKRSISVAQHTEDVPSAPEISAKEEVPDKVKKITIADHNESASDLADKLDKTIAQLDKTETEEPAEAEKTDEKSAEPAANEEEIAKEQVAEPLPEEPEAEIEVKDPEIIDDPATDKAVAEIVAEESDVLLEVEDALKDTDEPAEEKVSKPKQKGRFKKWLKKPAVRTALVVLLVALLLTAGAMPASRYTVLNTVGVRAQSSLVILDESTNQPLKNVRVSIGSSSGTTNAEGAVQLRNVKLGPNTLTVEKRAFQTINKPVVVGWGSNPLGEFKLHPTGTQFTFSATDFLSGKPLSKLEASTNDATALSDDKGIIKLTIDKPGDQPFTVTIKGDGMRTENIKIDPNDKADHAVKFVPARKHLFISKRSGKYDIYSAYADGQDEKVVLAGNGFEREGMALVQHPSDSIAAYVSTRGNQHNSDGYLLNNLLMVDTDTGTTTNVAVSERIQLIDWSGDYLVYVQVAAGASANSPKRYRLMSYNYKTDNNKELAASNYFNDVVALDHAIYYAPSSAYQSSQTAFYKINADGSGQQTVLNQEVWNIFRTGYNYVVLSVQQQWYEYRAGDKSPTKLNAAPADQTPRVYINSQDGAHSVRAENRDGKGTLLVYDTQTKTETALTAQSGLGYPIYWLSNKVLVYRIKTNQETADYAMSIDGGNPVKIKDVTPSLGLDKWYYY